MRGALIVGLALAVSCDAARTGAADMGAKAERGVFDESPHHAFPAGMVTQPIDRLPPELLGRWRREREGGWEYLLISATALVETTSKYGPLGGSIRPVARAGEQYAVRYGVPSRASERILEATGTTLSMTVRFSDATVEYLARIDPRRELLGRQIAEGGMTQQWERITEPDGRAAWVERAEWALDRATERSDFVDAAQRALQLAFWPFRQIDVVDIYSIRRGELLDFVILYQHTGIKRHWVSLLGPEGLRSTGDFLTLGRPVPPEPAHRSSEVDVHPSLVAWVEQWVVPILPR